MTVRDTHSLPSAACGEVGPAVLGLCCVHILSPETKQASALCSSCPKPRAQKGTSRHGQQTWGLFNGRIWVCSHCTPKSPDGVLFTVGRQPAAKEWADTRTEGRTWEGLVDWWTVRTKHQTTRTRGGEDWLLHIAHDLRTNVINNRKLWLWPCS